MQVQLLVLGAALHICTQTCPLGISAVHSALNPSIHRFSPHSHGHPNVTTMTKASKPPNAGRQISGTQNMTRKGFDLPRKHVVFRTLSGMQTIACMQLLPFCERRCIRSPHCSFDRNTRRARFGLIAALSFGVRDLLAPRCLYLPV
jgi:hypothetical protein